MNILFILNFYYPNKNASGACVYELINKLVSKGENAYVICFSDKDSYYFINNVHIYTLHTEISLMNKTNCHSYLDLSFWFNYIMNYPVQYPNISKRIVEKVKILNQDISIDLIIGVINPIESAKCLIDLKKNKLNIPLISYELDTIADLNSKRGLLSLITKIKRLYFENKVLKAVDGYIYMNCHKKHYDNKRYLVFQNKMYESDFPLFSPMSNLHKNTQLKENIVMVFAGALIKGVRSPIRVIEILSSLSSYTNVLSFFYSRGDYEIYLNKLQNKYVISKGYVASDTLNKAIEEADFLLSIGNIDTKMMPSKIFSYLSLQKPIIHFYSTKFDPCIKVLKDCNHALLVDVSKQNKICVHDIVEFINKMKNYIIPPYDINYLKYNRPEYTLKVFNKILSKE